MSTDLVARTLSLWSVLPFVLLLLSIAILPLAAPSIWESNRNKLFISLIFAIPTVLFLCPFFGFGPFVHAGIEYVQFITLLGALYIISGGILVTGDIEATPRNNTLFLALGAVLASVIGTTGASMLLIRPLLATNAERRHVAHTVVFFIFTVSNIGGCLTPLGDPPLFLGYLRSVPFVWTMSLWPEWLMTVGALLVIYRIWDGRAYKTERPCDLDRDKVDVLPIRVQGLANLVWFLGVVGSVVFLPSIDIRNHRYVPYRELSMALFALLSLGWTDRALRDANRFGFEAIEEVAVLFLGIFVTMVPALLILNARGAGLGVDSPAKFFWCAGALSSFLDNAPTYATFFELARSVTTTAGLEPRVAGVFVPFLRAVSLGAVFMGANTYIGNGPNFMVKSIAESQRVRMPSFFGYMAYSGAVLLPLFALLTLVAL